MNYHRILCVAVAVGFAFAAKAEGEQVREHFGKWRLAIGGSFNSPVRSDLGLRNLPSVPRVGSDTLTGASKDDAMRRARNRQYDGGGYISADQTDNGWSTENWKLPVSAYRGDGRFLIDNSYQELVGKPSSYGYFDDSNDPSQWGLSFEISRELWVYDEEAEHRWGVDFAFGFSYFFQRNAFYANGYASGGYGIRDGVIRTEVNDPDAMYDYDMGYDSPVRGMYGHGNFVNDFNSPALLWENVGSAYDAGGPVQGISATRGFSASGDYQELEMLFMFRPWYEFADWWRVYGQLGLGVSWGLFSSEYSAEGVNCSEDFDQWDCYGVVGLGTMFRYGRFDISLDLLARFLRDDMDIDGQFVNGSLSRSDWGLRLMVGVEF